MTSNSQSVSTAAKTTPKDAQLMAAILKDMGVTEYEPKVINQMLEFTYRYVTDVLEDAKAYSSHASKKTVDADDVSLAIHTKMDNSFTTPPPRELLLELARTKNAQPLPLIKQGIGVRLPPDRFCFLAPNFRVKAKESGKAPGLNLAGATNRPISSSLQANAIQAALGAGRRYGQNPRPSPTASSTSGTQSASKGTLQRPSVNQTGATSSAEPTTQQIIPRGVSLTSASTTQQPHPFLTQPQQSHQLQSSMGMVRPVSLPGGVTGLKRKLEDD